jgi:hypothetical protein
MGEVYRASDTRLGREVALKVLPADGEEDEKRVRRFEQEARAASSLNHPNIVVVYEFGDARPPGHETSVHYLAMELLEGETLDSMLQKGSLTVRRCLELAVPLADGLARAHESGIVHRDLKPSNIVVGPHGQPKIVDFGVAKLRSITDEERAGSQSDTMTAAGTVVGTVGYMSPEQARGEPATAASDQFSFGCILYEMLTGRRAFARSSPAETISTILRDEPEPIERLNPAVPAPLRWIIERCLAKSSEDRYVATRDLARDLHLLREHLADAVLSAAPPPLERRARVMWPRLAAIALLLLVIGSAGTLVLKRYRPRLEPEFRPLTFRHGLVGRALFAPRTNSILYTAAWDGQPGRTFQTIPESAGFDRSLDAEPQLPLAYSEDGSQVLVLLGAFRAATVPRGTLAWWPAMGGKARHLLEDVGWSDWAPKGQFLVVVRDTGAERVLEIRDAEGNPQRALFRTGGAISYVRVSPDERHVAFIRHPSIFEPSGEVWVVAADGTAARALTARFSTCRGLDWNSRTGEIWFTGSRANSWGSALWAVGLSGPAHVVHVLSNVFILQSISWTGDRCLITSSQDVATLTVRHAGRPPEDRSWFGWTVVTDLSPDDQSILFFDGGATEKTWGTWIRPIAGGDAVRLGDGVPSRFSPDARWIVAPVSTADGPPQLVLMPVGAGAHRQLTASAATHQSPSFAGPTTLLFVRSEAGISEVWRMETDGSGARSLGASGCDMPVASPSRASFLCAGDSGRTLFVFPMERGPGRKLLELPPGGRFKYARWNGRGDRAYAVTSDRRFMKVDVMTGNPLSEEVLPLAGAGEYDSVIGAAANADASLVLYSVARMTSDLYLVTGVN